MSRFGCTLYRKSFIGKRLVDDNCVIGYDEPMQTYFFQSGQENQIGEPVIWLGRDFNEFNDLSDLEKVLNRNKLLLKMDNKTKKALSAIA